MNSGSVGVELSWADHVWTCVEGVPPSWWTTCRGMPTSGTALGGSSADGPVTNRDIRDRVADGLSLPWREVQTPPRRTSCTSDLSEKSRAHPRPRSELGNTRGRGRPGGQLGHDHCVASPTNKAKPIRTMESTKDVERESLHLVT